jgi:hypothetical protein
MGAPAVVGRAAVKVASFTVRATEAQSIRWKRAADAEGFASAGAWLADAADAYLKARARAGRPLPLAWRRGRFSVVLMDGCEISTPGMVSPPFAIFQGSSHGPDRNKVRTLVYLPGRRVVATLRSSRQCRALAAELAPLLLRNELPNPDLVVERHVRESV